MARRRACLTKVRVRLPFGLGEAEWTPDDLERRAAWSLYVELITRIAVQPLPEGQGRLREALTSLHELFAVTRRILRDAGPDIGRQRESVGQIAIEVLNQGLRPFLSRWHTELSRFEAEAEGSTSTMGREPDWPREGEFREDLSALQKQLEQYAMVLAQIARVSWRSLEEC